MSNYTFSHKAYLKIFLHAAKYPHKRLVGVLIGTQTGSKVLVDDAIPILHNWSHNSPMMSLAIDLAGIYAKNASKVLVGYYQSNERVDDHHLGTTGEEVVAYLKKSFTPAVAVVVQLYPSDEAALIPYVSEIFNGQWKPHPSSFSPFSPFQLQNQSSPLRVKELLKAPHSLHRKLVDFDDHLENVQLDWLRNPECDDKEWKH